MSQLSFSFAADSKNYRADDFVELKQNQAASTFLRNFLSQRDFSASPIQSMILQGEKSCGKTHLLKFFGEKFNLNFVEQSDEMPTKILANFQENDFVIFEDLQLVKNQEWLFHLINSAREAKLFLILTSDGTEKFSLKDLNSRIKNIAVCRIENLSEKSLEELVLNRLSRRQIRLSQKAIKAITGAAGLNYSKIDQAIDNYLSNP